MPVCMIEFLRTSFKKISMAAVNGTKTSSSEISSSGTFLFLTFTYLVRGRSLNVNEDTV